MDILKQQLEQRLKANVLIDKCMHTETILFRDSWCTQDRVIRFATPYFRQLFESVENETGKWRTGDSVMYEINNSPDSFIINCVFFLSSKSRVSIDVSNKLMVACGKTANLEEMPVIIKSWDLSSYNDVNQLFDAFDQFLQVGVPAFENDLKRKMENLDSGLLKEGDVESITSNKYERNPKARAACLAAHGTACAVCGIDFGKEYGPEFAGKIEVHHIVPLSQIGEEYIVDPLKDLIPVCPNCHTALHSKKGGVYTIQELKEMRSKR